MKSKTNQLETKHKLPLPQSLKENGAGRKTKIINAVVEITCSWSSTQHQG
jgi:hypothetical protein